ncbi:hypothetical protein MATL_G00204230 [Megalops atlanticus]|uniref:Endonuclease/exonuclease/phosphatase domain-containing protein n=1 Tax=Megalops atlanticus TaxID=7932 RepID=A0A9D3PJW8_MEGAT|nr:hypothetical protein MATL_G00204230 [Megalops atlanticus]
MYRSTSCNYVYPYAPYRPMFTRHLNAVGSSWFPPTRALLGKWRSPYPLHPSWWTEQPPQQSYSSRHSLANFKTPVAPHSGWWRQAIPGLVTNGYQKGLHLSCGLMDGADREPPHKRRRSPGEGRTEQRSWHTPDRSSPQQTQSWKGSPDSRFWNDPPHPASPAKITTSPRKTRQPSEIKRQWEDFSHLYKHRDQSFDFSVMSYNILAQDLLQNNAYLYRHCQSSVLDWNHRFPNILKELELHDADILCLQEVQEDHYQKQLKPSLESLGYHCEYKRRTGRKLDGCAVSFKRDRFSLVSCHPVEYFRRGVPLLDRDNVGLVLLLRPAGSSDSGRDLCVANTHLLYNPRRGDIKLTQLAMLLAEISHVSRLPDGSTCPVILCGDFNSVPWSPLYSFIRENRLEYEGMPIGRVSGQEETPRGQRLLTVPIWPQSVGVSQQCQYEHAPGKAAERNNGEEAFAALSNMSRASIAHSLRLTSAYSHRLKANGRPEITTCHSKTAITVDYIFYSAAQGDVGQPECSAAPEEGLQLLARLALVDERDMWTANGLPNEHNSSDHLPLLVRFRLRP